MNLKPLPIGIASWSELRHKHFVDKTAKVLDLLALQSKVYLCRPRYFGKTTLLSIITELFLHGDKNFAGTAIHGRWPYATGAKVLNISFNGIKLDKAIDQANILNPDSLEREICAHAKLAWAKSDSGEVEIKSFSELVSFDVLFPALARLRGDDRLILLVDDWDGLLNAHSRNQDLLRSTLNVITRFFSLVRALQPSYMLVTGSTHHNEATAILGGNLLDLSRNQHYADLLGFTQHELEDNFGPYISEAARRLSLTEEALLDQLQLYYRSYSFDPQAQLYCPQAINTFFNQLLTSH